VGLLSFLLSCMFFYKTSFFRGPTHKTSLVYRASYSIVKESPCMKDLRNEMRFEAKQGFLRRCAQRTSTRKPDVSTKKLARFARPV